MSADIRFYSRLQNGYWWLSNFSRHGFTLNGEFWRSVEHFYQAMKFADPECQRIIREVETPREAKWLGSRPGLRPDWEDLKEQAMRVALQAKFAAHPGLAHLLRLTEDAILIEDSPSDYYWGCGRDGTGKNRLGHLLMELRARPDLGVAPTHLYLPPVPEIKVATAMPDEDWPDFFEPRCKASLLLQGVVFGCEMAEKHEGPHKDVDATWTDHPGPGSSPTAPE